MTETSLEEKLFNEFSGELKPGKALDNVRPDLARVEPKFFEMYKGEKVEDSKLEDGFNSVSKSYVTALYDLAGKPQPLVDGPEWYGNLMRDWVNKLGDQALGQVKAAIKAGNRAEVLRVFNEAYQAQANKLTSIISKIQGQPSEVQMSVYQTIAKALGGNNVAKVATNVGAAAQALGGTYTTQDAYK